MAERLLTEKMHTEGQIAEKHEEMGHLVETVITSHAM